MARTPQIAETAARGIQPSANYAPRAASGNDFGGQIGAALGEAGSALEGVSRGIEGLELARAADQKRLRNFTLETNFLKFSQEETERLAQQEQEIGGGGWDFAQQFRIGHAARAEDWLVQNDVSDADEQEMGLWRQRQQALYGSLSGAALGAEFAERNRFYTEEIGASLDTIKTGINQNPEGFDDYLQQGQRLIEMSGLGAGAKDSALLRWEQQAATAYGQALVQRSPEDAMAAMGGPVTEAGDYSGPAGEAKGDFDFFRSRGLSGVAAAAVVGVLSWESGGGLAGINPGGRNPGDGNDGSDSIGAGQWNAERADALKAFARARGKPWNDKSVQLEFVMHEFQTTEPEAYRRLQAATTLEQAVEAMSYYERPQGWRNGGDPTRVIHWNERLERARHFAGAVSEGFDPQNAPGMVSPGNIDLAHRPVVQNADGTISTVRSVSIEQDGKEVLIPTVSPDGRILSDDEAVALYEQTGQNLGVFETADQATAFAERLHEEQAQRYRQPADPRLAALPYDARMQLMGAAARGIEQGIQQRAAAAQEAQAAQINALELRVLQGEAGVEEVQAALDAGVITDATDYNRLTNAAETQAKKNEDINLFSSLWADPTHQWNPYDTDQKAAVEAAYQANDRGLGALQGIVDRTGIVPPSAATQLRGSLLSNDPMRVGQAASLASNIIARQPNAFTALEGGKDIEQAAAMRDYYVNTLGLNDQQAAARLAADNDPVRANQIRPDEQRRTAFNRTVRENVTPQAIVNALPGANGRILAAAQSQSLMQDYAEIAADNFARYGDEGAARAAAQREINRLYGISANGTFTKYPPEKIYPPDAEGRHTYIYDQAAERVRLNSDAAPTSRDVFLIPLPTVTAEAWRQGQPPAYSIGYRFEQDGQQVYGVLPGGYRFNPPARQAGMTDVQASRTQRRVRESTRNFSGLDMATAN